MNDDMYDQSRGKKYSTDDGSVTSSNVDESQIYNSVQSMDALLQDLSVTNDDLAQNETESTTPPAPSNESPQAPVTPDQPSAPEVDTTPAPKDPATSNLTDTPEVTDTPTPVVVTSQSTKKKAPLALILGIILALLAVTAVIFLIFNNLNARREDFTSSQSTIARTQLTLSQTKTAADRVISAIPAGDSVSRGDFETYVADLVSARESFDSQLIALSEMPALQIAAINSEHEAFHLAATAYSEKLARIIIVVPALFEFSTLVADFDIAAISRGDTSSIDAALAPLLESPDPYVQRLGEDWDAAVSAFVAAFERFTGDPLDPYAQANFDAAYADFLAHTADLASIDWLTDLQITASEFRTLETHLTTLSDLIENHLN